MSVCVWNILDLDIQAISMNDFRFRIHSIRQYLEKGRRDSIYSIRLKVKCGCWLVEWIFVISWFILIYLPFPFGWFCQLSSPSSSSSSLFSVSNFHCSFVLFVHQLIDAIVWIFAEILRRILSLNDISISTQALSPRKNMFLSTLALPSIVSGYCFLFLVFFLVSMSFWFAFISKKIFAHSLDCTFCKVIIKWSKPKVTIVRITDLSIPLLTINGMPIKSFHFQTNV